LTWTRRDPTRDRQVKRFRYQLEGVDKGWQNMDAAAGFAVLFHDKDYLLVERLDFFGYGYSAGWKDTIENSPLVRRREIMNVPAGAVYMSFVVSSAGPPDAMGIYAMGNLAAYRQDKDKLTQTFPLLKNGQPEAGPDDAAFAWLKDGTHPSMAKTLHLASLAHSDWALSIIDNDPLGHADWRLRRENYIGVNPGEKMIIEWDEVYNFGASAQHTRLYPCPPAGVYKFRIETEDATGISQEERTYTINVFLPFWKKSWFIAGAGLVLVVVLFLIVRLFVKIRMKRVIRKMENDHMLERERFRIARNIHDNLGARLTHITLVSGRSEFEDRSSDDFRRSVRKISEMTRDLVSSLYETVWAIDPENDHLDSLVTHLVQMTENLSEAAGLLCRVDAPDLIEAHTLSSVIRHAVSLTVKEAVHNAIKHSNATEITITIGVQASELSVEIRDNGRGFAMRDVRQGSGLRNMRGRMAEIGASIEIQGNEGEGTAVILRVPFLERAAKR